LLERVRRRVDKLQGLVLSEICFVSVVVVVQGRGQLESWVPSKRSSMVAKELLPEIKWSQCHT
jgi:hypothetical protein